MVSPITIDSGIPSSTLPSTIASAEPSSWSPFGSLRSPPPMRSITQSPPKKTHAAGEDTNGDTPFPDDLSAASSIRSNDTALISTPAPKPMISPIVRRLRCNQSAISAPITSEEAARVPHPNDSSICHTSRWSQPRTRSARQRDRAARRRSPADRLELAGSPGLVEERLERAVEAQGDEPAPLGVGLDPVARCDSVGLARREVDDRGAVRLRARRPVRGSSGCRPAGRAAGSAAWSGSGCRTR